MLEIKKIRLFELEDFVQSEMFRRFDTAPITSARAKSYLENPRAKSEDVVLYLGFFGKQLVAFRSLFADFAFVDENPIRFAWCSGSWVHPDFRRRGYSQKLLVEAYSDWDKRLMFTNYAPESEQLYLKTGWFKSIHQFKGVRCYLFPKTRKLLAISNKNGLTKIIYSGIDSFIHIYSTFKIVLFKPKINPEFRFEEMDLPDRKCYEMVQKKRPGFLFQRKEEEIKWIFNHPWLLEKNDESEVNYPFSSYSKEFFYKTVKVYRLNKFAGFFIFSVKDRHLKTLYHQIEKGMEYDIGLYLKNFCVKHRLEMATVYQSELAEVLFKRKSPFLHVKKMGQKIYSTFDIHGTFRFQDGDGDVFFT